MDPESSCAVSRTIPLVARSNFDHKFCINTETSCSSVAEVDKTFGGSNVAERSAVGAQRTDRGAFGHNRSTNLQDFRRFTIPPELRNSALQKHHPRLWHLFTITFVLEALRIG